MLLRQRSAFAVQHLMGAARFSRQCGEIERANEGADLGSFFDAQIACVSATVMLSVASLESNINEYLADGASFLPELPSFAAEEFIALVSELPILEKYERVLRIKGRPLFDRGARPYQDVATLISTRNELVHFHPEWHDEQERHAKLGAKLRACFSPSPFIAESTGVMFPQRFVSHGCCRWAVESALAFMSEFAARADVQNRFERFIERIRAL